MKKISCIISAYNEESRIGRVLDALKDHPLIDEIIVVDDGSTDRTREIANANPKVQLISLLVNNGKSNAIALGIGQARNTLLMLLDADLIGLTHENITALAQPVLSGNADITISLRKNSLRIYKLIGFDFYSGERVFPKILLADYLETLKKLPGFGLETFMNELTIERRYRIVVVPWRNVSHARKSDKIGFWKGRKEELRMAFQILKMLSLGKIIRQNYALLSLTRRAKN